MAEAGGGEQTGSRCAGAPVLGSEREGDGLALDHKLLHVQSRTPFAPYGYGLAVAKAAQSPIPWHQVAPPAVTGPLLGGD